jgi:tetraacyldisaccharide-1-P 4'-kinase
MLVNAWYQKAFWLHLLRPLSVLFSVLAARRRQRQQAQQRKPGIPVVVVGNITVGGTGKTPVVRALAEALHSQGLRVGVLSRGYGGRAPAYPFDVLRDSDVGFTGDEAKLLRKYLQGPLMLDPDRSRGLKTLAESGRCDVIISDDGLQHYRLWRDIEIVMVDGQRGLGNGYCLPAGPLREPRIATSSEVDYLVINGESHLDLSELATIGAPDHIVDLHHRYGSISKAGRDWPSGVASWPHRHMKCMLWPESAIRSAFLIHLPNWVITPNAARLRIIMPIALMNWRYASGRLLLMTEKDAVKCESLCRGKLVVSCGQCSA